MSTSDQSLINPHQTCRGSDKIRTSRLLRFKLEMENSHLRGGGGGGGGAVMLQVASCYGNHKTTTSFPGGGKRRDLGNEVVVSVT